MLVFWFVTPCGLVGRYQRFRRWSQYVPPKRRYLLINTAIQHRKSASIFRQLTCIAITNILKTQLSDDTVHQRIIAMFAIHWLNDSICRFRRPRGQAMTRHRQHMHLVTGSNPIRGSDICQRISCVVLRWYVSSGIMMVYYPIRRTISYV
jgi:hypothetical protein